ncbi:MAG: response regulator [Erysipelotrichaceae bacterium]|nr:response regulator [Erysipelotrichaceae bacterium]
MAREYAVYDGHGTDAPILYQTEGFEPTEVTAVIDLSEEKQLRISGSDSMQDLNEELILQLKEMENAGKAKDAFLSNMSHDIRTPMNAIIGMTALARKHIDEKARVLDSLNKIETASAHLLSLINEVLDMSRIDSGRLALAEEAFSLSDLLHDILTIVRPQMQQKGHQFSFDVRDISYESLVGDTLRLRQIYVNIINNAVKYTEANGEITVKVSESTEGERCWLNFLCRDNGIGMTAEFLEKIFEPFERANSTTISRIEGTGLGMSIVKRLVEAMSGSIHIDSAPGKGTAVEIRIPLRYEHLEVHSEELQGKRVLIVEADEELRDDYRRCLKDAGLHAVFVSSASEAVAQQAEDEFRDQHADAVIIGHDIGKDGSIYDLASYLHQRDPQLPIILISDDNWEDIEYKANHSGIEYFLPIPFFRKSLLNGLSEALRGARGSDPLTSVDLHGKHILLVEDNLINREIAREILSSTHAEIDTAEDGKIALEKFKDSVEDYYDLILMDIQMPVMDGYEASKAIRALDRKDASTVKIFAMTANAFAEDIAKAYQAGMNEHLAKPVDIAKLMQALRRI